MNLIIGEQFDLLTPAPPCCSRRIFFFAIIHLWVFLQRHLLLPFSDYRILLSSIYRTSKPHPHAQSIRRKRKDRMLFPRHYDFRVWNVEGFAVSYRVGLSSCQFSNLHRYTRALTDQPRKALLPEPWNIVIPAALAIVGQVFVLTSTWQLGITGTFLGDYFGILMDAKVEG